MTEKQNVEYKIAWRDEYLKWICGFANAQGGTLSGQFPGAPFSLPTHTAITLYPNPCGVVTIGSASDNTTFPPGPSTLLISGTPSNPKQVLGSLSTV